MLCRKQFPFCLLQFRVSTRTTLEKMGSSSTSILVPYDTGTKIRPWSELLREYWDMFKIEKKYLKLFYFYSCLNYFEKGSSTGKMEILNRVSISQSIFHQTF